MSYYDENREWLTRLAVWVNCEGQRRPSSGFILATLAVLEPNLTQILPLIVDLSNNPDRIVMALGLNFNPDDELEAIAKGKSSNRNGRNRSLRMLPAADAAEPLSNPHSRRSSQIDESCRGVRDDRE